jgi:hypothetical protein
MMLDLDHFKVNLPEEIAPGVTALKALDEYNYLLASATRKGGG